MATYVELARPLLSVKFVPGFAYATSGTCNYCKDNWVRFQESCYLFGKDARAIYTDSELYCNKFGANLVSIESRDENEFLREYSRGLVKNDFWIGLSDRVTEGAWKWEGRGSLGGFTDWSPGQPDNNYGVASDCVGFHHIHNWHWDDVSCALQFYPLCEVNNTAASVSIVG